MVVVFRLLRCVVVLGVCIVVWLGWVGLFVVWFGFGFGLVLLLVCVGCLDLLCGV